jgi:hypothetical protein
LYVISGSDATVSEMMRTQAIHRERRQRGALVDGTPTRWAIAPNASQSQESGFDSDVRGFSGEDERNAAIALRSRVIMRRLLER